MKLKEAKREIMTAHHEAVKSGKMCVARVLLKLLLKKRIALGIGDTDWKAEEILNSIGISVNYTARGTAYFYLPRK